MRARAFGASFEPLTPLLRSARRDTGFPAAASLTDDAGLIHLWAGDPEVGSYAFTAAPWTPNLADLVFARGPVLVCLLPPAV